MALAYPDARSNFYKENTDNINRHWATNERIFLLQHFGLTSSNESNSDLYKRLFTDLGYTGSLSDMWYQFLTEEGYPGALREKQRDFWISGSFVPVPSLLYFNSSSVPEDGKLYSGTSGQKRQIQPGRCYNLDGTNDYVDFGNNPVVEINTAWEVEVNVLGGPNTYRVCYSEGSSSSTTPFFVLRSGSSATTLEIFWRNSVSTTIANVNYTGILGSTAKKVKVTYNGTDEMEVLVDGVSLGTTAVTPSGLMATNRVTLGAFGRSSYSGYFDGKLWGLHTWADGIMVINAKCDEADGTTSYDSSGNGNDGTITNATLSTFHSTQDVYSYQNNVGYNLVGGVYIPRDESDPTNDVLGNPLLNTGVVKPYALIKASNCGDFDGADDYIDCGDSSDFSFGNGTTDKPFSVSSWVNSDSIPATNTFQGIIGKDDGVGQREWALLINDIDTKFRFFIKNNLGSSQQSIDSTSVLVANTWYHVTATYDGRGGNDANEGMKIYVDAVSETPTNIQNSTYTAMNDGTSPMTVGKYGANEFNGKICDTRLYSKELTSDEVKFIHSAGAEGTDPTNANLVAEYPLAEGAGTTAFDKSGNDNHGTITNASLATFWSTQDAYANNITNGFEHYDDDATGLVIIRVPYKTDGTQITPTISGYTKNSNNPPVAGHNNAESVFDFKNVALGDIPSPSTAHLAASTDFTAFSFDADTGWDSYDYAFYRQDSSIKNDRFLIYSEDLTGANLTKAENYTGN